MNHSFHYRCTTFLFSRSPITESKTNLSITDSYSKLRLSSRFIPKFGQKLENSFVSLISIQAETSFSPNQEELSPCSPTGATDVSKVSKGTRPQVFPFRRGRFSFTWKTTITASRAQPPRPTSPPSFPRGDPRNSRFETRFSDNPNFLKAPLYIFRRATFALPFRLLSHPLHTPYPRSFHYLSRVVLYSCASSFPRFYPGCVSARNAHEFEAESRTIDCQYLKGCINFAAVSPLSGTRLDKLFAPLSSFPIFYSSLAREPVSLTEL